jgi:hypothetical protein
MRNRSWLWRKWASVRRALVSSMRFVAPGRFLEVWILASRRRLVTRLASLGYQSTVVLESGACLSKLARAFDLALAEVWVEAGGVLC